MALLRPHGVAGRYEILIPFGSAVEEGHPCKARGKRVTVHASKAPDSGHKDIARHVVPFTGFLKLKQRRTTAAIHD